MTLARTGARVGSVSTSSWRLHLRMGLLGSDLAVIIVTLVIARLAPVAVHSPDLDDITPFVWTSGVVIAAIWLSALGFTRSRDARVLETGLTEYVSVIDATLLSFGVVAIGSYLLQLQLSRLFFLVALPVGTVLLLVSRWVWRKVLGRLRGYGGFSDRVLLVGTHADVHDVAEEFTRAGSTAMTPTAICCLDRCESPHSGRNGELDVVDWYDVVDRASYPDIDCVAIAGDIPGGRQEMRRLAWALETANVDLVTISRMTDVAEDRMQLLPVGGLTLVRVSLPRYRGFAVMAKRTMDVIVSSLALLVSLPAFALIALAIKLDDGGPVFFRQLRVGANGRPFRIWKFRSMSIDAEARKAELMLQNEGSGPLFKLKADPRITRVGAFLRKTSLDELPQFINALLGEMSVVGPRPPLPVEVEGYDSDAKRRLLIRPGITGAWQVGGRSDLSWSDSVRLDLHYVENWSITRDLAIIAKTVVVMFQRNGAY